MTAPAILVLSAGGLATARAIAAALPGATLHGLASRVETPHPVTDVGAHARELFRDGVPLIGVCAAGVLIRALAPVLADKSSEPPVVAVAEDGSVAVPLLGGHHGANALARTIARALGGVAALTTAGEVRLGLALDDPPPGWRVGNPTAAKSVMAALLAGEKVRLHIDAAEEDCGWLVAVEALMPSLSKHEGGAHDVLVTDRAGPSGEKTLVLHPGTLALGVGCERGAPPEGLIALARRALADQGFAPESVACVASIALKAAEPAVHALAHALGVKARFFEAAALLAETPRLANPSDIVFRETGCHGVAEGAALAAAGPLAALVVPKRAGDRSTVALARSPRIIDVVSVGRARGHLMLVGIGPGNASGRTHEASAAIARATDLVGYGLYLDLAGDLAAGKTRHDFALGEEQARVRHALDLAASGRDVALLSSGDIGIYAMAALAFEEIERAGDGAWARVEIGVVPGVSAMQVAAARAGAPLGHDFCAISLSDLMTPWPVIEARLRAAAAGDFVVALYNPASGRRRDGFLKAIAILAEARAPTTPVVIARNLGRPGETTTTVTLAEMPQDIDMMTLVIVGSSTTRILARPDGTSSIYTPRGYASKDTGS